MPVKFIQFQVVNEKSENVTIYALDDKGKLWYSTGHITSPTWYQVKSKFVKEVKAKTIKT